MRNFIFSFFLFALYSCEQKQASNVNFGISVDTAFYTNVPIQHSGISICIPKGFKTAYQKPLLDPDPFSITNITIEDSLRWRLNLTVRMFKNYELNYFSFETMKREFYKYALSGLKHEVKSLVDSCSYEREGYIFLYRNIMTTDVIRDSSIYQVSIIFSRRPYVFTSNFSFWNYTEKVDTLLKQYVWINAKYWSLPK